MVAIFETAMYVLLTLFVIVAVYFVGVVMVGGYVYPIFSSSLFTPDDSAGMSAEQYDITGEHLWNGMRYAFYIIFGTLFAFFVIKYLYEREERSYTVG